MRTPWGRSPTCPVEPFKYTVGQAILLAGGIRAGSWDAGWKAGCGQEWPPHGLRLMVDDMLQT